MSAGVQGSIYRRAIAGQPDIISNFANAPVAPTFPRVEVVGGASELLLDSTAGYSIDAAVVGTENDVMIVAVACEHLSTAGGGRPIMNITPPAGFTAVFADADGVLESTETNSGRFQIYYRVLGASEPASYAFASDQSDGQMELSVSTLRGVTLPISVSAVAGAVETVSNGDVTCPAVSGTFTDALTIRGLFLDDAAFSITSLSTGDYLNFGSTLLDGGNSVLSLVDNSLTLVAEKTVTTSVPTALLNVSDFGSSPGIPFTIVIDQVPNFSLTDPWSPGSIESNNFIGFAPGVDTFADWVDTNANAPASSERYLSAFALNWDFVVDGGENASQNVLFRGWIQFDTVDLTTLSPTGPFTFEFEVPAVNKPSSANDFGLLWKLSFARYLPNWSSALGIDDFPFPPNIGIRLQRVGTDPRDTYTGTVRLAENRSDINGNSGLILVF